MSDRANSVHLVEPAISSGQKRSEAAVAGSQVHTPGGRPDQALFAETVGHAGDLSTFIRISTRLKRQVGATEKLFAAISQAS